MQTKYLSVLIIFSFIALNLNRYDEVNMIPYPSVSVCTEYTYKTYIEKQIFSNSSMEEAENLVKSFTWKRNETFYFVNQKYENMSDYPCITIPESNDPGRPCVFPFKNKE